MTPRLYYDCDGIQIYHGDALDVLPTLVPSSVDLIIADPPYFRVKDEWWDRQWDSADLFLEWICQLCQSWRRLLKPNGSLYCFASPQMAARVEVEIAKLFNVLNRITWKKENGWAKRQCKEEQRIYFPSSEAIIFAEQYGSDAVADGFAGYGSQCSELHKRVYGPMGGKIAAKRVQAGLSIKELAKHFPSKSGGITGCVWNWEAGESLPSEEQYIAICRHCGDTREYESLRQEYESLRRPFSVSDKVPCTDVWDFSVVTGYPSKHPCEKPLPMLEHIVLASSRADAVVLDSFVGGGAGLEAIRNCGRKGIGIEIEEKWCRVAANRLSQRVLFA